MSLGVWLVVAILIAINALYVVAEFAAVSVRRSRVQQLAEEGHRVAKVLLPVISSSKALDRYVAASQIGITLSSLILGAFGQATIGTWLQRTLEAAGRDEMAAAAPAVVLVVLTTLQVVFGELVPKSLALQFPVQTALYTALPMRWSLTLFSWFIAVLNGSGVLLLRLLGAPETAHRHIHSPDEIAILLAESEEGGLLEPAEHQRLHRALHVAARPARQLMVPRPYIVALDAATPPDEALRFLAESPYSRLPVYRESTDHIIGVLHTRDVVRHLVERDTLPDVEAMMRPMVSVGETVSVDRLLQLLRERHTHQALVLDEYGGVAGLVTLEDILAEVLADVGDEFKGDQPRPEQLPDGRVRLPGLMRLDDTQPWLGTTWEGKSDTVAGRVLEAVGHLPRPGETVVIEGMEVTVERIQGRAIASVLARPAAQQEEAGDE